MHAWVSYTSADTHGCRLHQEPLDLLPGVFQVQTLRHKLQRLERIFFVRSLLYLHSCPKRAPGSSLCGLEALTLQVDFKWFQTITKLIRRDAFSANISPASARDERDILDHAKLVCTFWQPLQTVSPKALCKCMHECLTQALIRTVAGFTKSRLIFFRESFKYKLCDTNSSDLSVFSSFAPFCICTAVPNGLPVLAFADSKRSHCKWISNDSKPLLNWFGGMASAPIFLYPPSKIGVSLDGKSWNAGIERTKPWPCPSMFALRSIDFVRFRVKARV